LPSDFNNLRLDSANDDAIRKMLERSNFDFSNKKHDIMLFSRRKSKMANTNKAFLDFDNETKLTESRKDKILNSRYAVRAKIKKYFLEDIKVKQPKFNMQGSFTINTALNPINDNEVGIDDGVYLQHISDNDTWPTPKEAHQLILTALKGHTQDGCENKPSCVRVVYRNFYHLDLPIYIMKDDRACLAQTKLNEWQRSDSKDFKDWFYKQRINEQTSRIVRYLKTWRDYRVFGFSSIEFYIGRRKL
jgi:hypothetical protein